MRLTLWRSVAAIAAGNLVYFSIEHLLPIKARHQPFHIDWGLAVDFWICLAWYGLLRLIR